MLAAHEVEAPHETGGIVKNELRLKISEPAAYELESKEGLVPGLGAESSLIERTPQRLNSTCRCCTSETCEVIELDGRTPGGPVNEMVYCHDELKFTEHW